MSSLHLLKSTILSSLLLIRTIQNKNRRVSMQTLQGSDAALLAQRAVQLDGEGAAPAACAAYRAAAQALEDEAQLAAAEPQLQQSMLSRGASYRARAEELCVE